MDTLREFFVSESGLVPVRRGLGLDVQALDTGRHRAMVVDPKDRRQLQGLSLYVEPL